MSDVVVTRPRGLRETQDRKAPADPFAFFIEPEWATDLLLELPFFSLIRSAVDPCAGSGNVVRAVRRAGIECMAGDINPRQWASGETPMRCDFRHIRKLPKGVEAVISNPPYGSGKTAREFIEKMLSLKPAVLAVFVENRFLASAGRHSLFTTHRPTQIAFLSTRPSCPPGEKFLAGEIKAEGGKQDYCWLIWASWMAGMPQAPVWLRRSK